MWSFCALWGTTLMMSLLNYQHELKDSREFTDSAPRAVLTSEEMKMAETSD
jgi:hypothetical protein